MVDINKLVRENVIRLTPYSSARDEFQGSSGTFMDANENPFGSLNRYPDPYQKELKKAVSRIKGVGEERIFLGNGSDEIIDLCYRIFCTPGKDSALIFPPTYGMYEVAASANDVKVLKVPLDTELQIDVLKTGNLLTDKSLKLIFICSPNNPTANSMNYNDVESIISRFNGMVVIDEAYIDFSEKPSFMKLMSGYPNLIIMQTFSKAFGMAAVRVGMAFSDPQVIRYFNKMKPPYNISTVNQKAVLRKLEKQDEYRQQVQRIKSERERLAAILKGMSLVEKVYPSDANFLLVKVKNANYIYESLIRKNIVVRNRNSVIQNCIRITVGKPAENNKLINAFKSIAQ
jgi:histidinol-phosphate aminotransferase